jgi:hypothetical protein
MAAILDASNELHGDVSYVWLVPGAVIGLALVLNTRRRAT